MQATADDIIEMILAADKHRFHFFGANGRPSREVTPAMRSNPERIRVGCGQGHNRRVLAQINPERIMTLMTIDGPNWRDIVLHGTKQINLPGILRDGLKPGGADSGERGRAHVDLVSGLKPVGDQAGLRSGSTHLVRVNARRYVEAGGEL